MVHDHSHRPDNHHTAFVIGVTLNIGFVVVEAVYGLISGSMALLADAGHNLSDVAGLLMAWGAHFMATKRPTETHTYGYRRGTILAAMFSGLLILMATGVIAWEAVFRFVEPRAVDGATVIVVAAIGVVVNTATALLFLSGQKSDLNLKGAFLHMAADAVVSVGVVIAGIGIILTGWLWLDPVISLLIVAAIFVSTWGLVRDSFQLSMDRVPAHIELRDVEAWLRRYEGVEDVHDLHIWPVSTTDTYLTAHLVMPAGNPSGFLQRVSDDLHEQFGIGHATLQVEGPGDCQLGPAGC